ncbi:MAG: hypothetical protein AAGE01_01630 [Pseudomonadota bacterium]
MIEISEFARQKGVSEDRALEMVHEGRYHGKEVDGIWYIDPRRIRQSSRLVATDELPAVHPDEGGSGGRGLVITGLVIGAFGGMIAAATWPGLIAYGALGVGIALLALFLTLGLMA